MVDCFDYYKATAIVYAARLGGNIQNRFVNCLKLRCVFHYVGCAKTVSFLLPYSHHNVIDIFGQNVS
jgi:hypothetical protein